MRRAAAGHRSREGSPRRLAARRLPLLLLLLVLVPARAGRADEERPDPAEDVPVAVRATVDDADVGLTGVWHVTLHFDVLEDVDRPYRLEVRLAHRLEEVIALDHVPHPAVSAWRAGQVVDDRLRVPVPAEAGLVPGDRLRLLVAFRDPAADALVPPREADVREGPRARVAELVVPTPLGVDEPAGRNALLDRARSFAAAGRKADAWHTLARGVRLAAEDETKLVFRDELLALGPLEPPPLSPVEEAIVHKRIQEERTRWLRLMAGRYFDRGKLHAALRILEDLGGTLSEDADGAVIGALDDAQRVQRDLQDIRVRILARATEEEKAEAQELIDRRMTERARLRKALGWAEEGRYAPARIVLRALALGADAEVAAEARREKEALEEAWLAATPPDEADLVAEALGHPAFDRTTTSLSQAFIYIGPRRLVEGIPARSRLRFDLAYLFLTDLFGRIPNPGGDRITVYFKELWDFGGGVGGGKIIDIGRADPDDTNRRVDNGLLYHELTHCVDDTNPIFHGWREGLANFGAAYALEILSQGGDELHAFGVNLRAFHAEYLERDLPYWRIQNYGPSAGFFLHFVDKYARRGARHDWKPYRAFFRAYRAAPVRDGREPYLARSVAWHLVRAFGPEAFDDLLAFRFPLVASDREAIDLEMEAFAEGDHRVLRLAESLEGHENTPLRRDLVARRMLELAGRPRTRDEARRIAREELGILDDWWVIGPFRHRGTDPQACVFPPQHEIDLEAEYPGEANVCSWRRAGETGIVTLDALGWVGFRFAYQDDTATYALTHVTVPEDVEAHAHLRADDDVVLYVNDRLVGSYRDRGPNGSDGRWWRGPRAPVPDAIRLPVHLERGRNKVLVKVRNRRGEAGFVMALSRRDGRPIDGLAVDADPPPSGGTEAGAAKGPDFETEQRLSFRSRAARRRLDVAVGGLEVKNRILRGTDTDGRVLWRRYTVRPGFPRDAPSNLVWLEARQTEEIEDFRLTFDLVPEGDRRPKLAVTFQGEGLTDGLSGWTAIIHPHGQDAVGVRLERYDRLVHQAVPQPMPDVDDDETLPLVLTYVDGFLTLSLGETTLLGAVPITPIAGRHRIGFATWGRQPGIATIRLERPR